MKTDELMLNWNTVEQTTVLMDLGKNNESLDEEFFKDYKPTENDPLTPPKHIIYLLLAVSVTGVTLYAIIRHLIQDLIHDLAGMYNKKPYKCLFHHKQLQTLCAHYLDCLSMSYMTWCSKSLETGKHLNALPNA